MSESTEARRRARLWVPADWREVARNSGAGDSPRDQVQGLLYFAKAGPWLKIGWSANPRRRMKELRSPERHKPALLGVVRGNRQEETTLLACLQETRDYGEWCPVSPELLEAVFDLLRREGVEIA